FDVAQRHHLPLINILNPDATMNQNAGPYKGMDRFAGRKKILEDLEKSGQLVKIEPYSHAVGHCARCGTVVEPLASKQWFVKTQPLAEPAIKAVTDGRIKILPERFTKVYLNWMENIRDWCISRQLWWGHRIPVWYCKDCGELTVAMADPAKCSHCDSVKIEQDPDVLDTWFSSGLWTHSTLGWPDKTEDLRYFYPTSVMETGYDILFFWVARMIMMGLEDMDDIPFHTVYLHGLIRDERGEKMSKVKGNVLNPIVTLEQYGTDALRFALSTGTSPGNDTKLTASKLEAGRNFANKMWNATRFILRRLPPEADFKAITANKRAKSDLPLEDRWILSRLSRTVACVTRQMEDFQFGEAEMQIYDFLWSEFCDWYIELTKVRLSPDSQAPSPLPVLVEVLETSLRLLHPYMPFVTEELWQNLRSRVGSSWPESIMIAPYPQADSAAIDPQAEETIDTIIEIVRSIRNVRAQYKVEAGRWIEARIYAGDLTSAITPYTEAVQGLSRAKPISFLTERPEAAAKEKAVALVLKKVEIAIPMASMFDIEAEKKRVHKETEEAQAEFTRLETRLKDEAFVSKAPPAVVEKERQKLAALADKLDKLRQQALNF
ncbi:MAG: valine--tRNA ligase, partial [Dehalococcoidales bacterium]|nr:valine--tRNA ligase [Dehalococcoidales bacterium]